MALELDSFTPWKVQKLWALLNYGNNKKSVERIFLKIGKGYLVFFWNLLKLSFL